MGAPIEELIDAWSPCYHGGQLSLLDYTDENGKLHSNYNFRWAGEYLRLAETAYDPEKNEFFEALPEERRSLLCEQQINVVDGIISNVGLGDSDCGELPRRRLEKSWKRLPDYARLPGFFGLSPAG